MKLSPDEPQEQDGDRHGDRYDETGDERRAPITQEEIENHAGQDEADQDGVAHAGDAFPDKRALVIEGLDVDAGRQLRAEFFHLLRHTVCDGDGIAARLAGDVQQHSWLSVCCHHRIYGQGGRHDICDVLDMHRSSAGRGFDD